jgi:hypothetical protein
VQQLSSDCNIRRYISMYILGRVHITVMFVTKLSRYWNSRSHINVYILGSVDIAVMGVIEHSLRNLL